MSDEKMDEVEKMVWAGERLKKLLWKGEGEPPTAFDEDVLENGYIQNDMGNSRYYKPYGELTFEKIKSIEGELLKKGKEYEKNRGVISTFEMDGGKIELSILGEKEAHRCLGYKIGDREIKIIDAGLEIEPFIHLLKYSNSTPEELMSYIEKKSFVYEHSENKEKLSEDLLEIFKAYKKDVREN